jgi:hypothetical protein
VQSRKTKKHSYTVRKVTDNHWGLVYMECPAKSAEGQIHRFQTEKDAQNMAQRLNDHERQISGFTFGTSVSPQS